MNTPDTSTAPPAASAESLADIRVGDVMSVALVTVGKEESVLMAWEILQRTGFHHLPVVDGDGRCLGLVERSDLAVVCAQPAASLSERYADELLAGHRPPLVHDDTPVTRAAAHMTELGVDALAVLDSAGTFVGLLTARDLVAVLAGRPRRARRTAGTGPVMFSLEPVLPYPFDD